MCRGKEGGTVICRSLYLLVYVGISVARDSSPCPDAQSASFWSEMAVAFLGISSSRETSPLSPPSWLGDWCLSYRRRDIVQQIQHNFHLIFPNENILLQ